MDRRCRVHRGVDNSIQNLLRKPEDKRPLVRSRFNWKVNIKIGLKQH
jgi:hypothetical protein